jgi:hypothetical protein
MIAPPSSLPARQRPRASRLSDAPRRRNADQPRRPWLTGTLLALSSVLILAHGCHNHDVDDELALFLPRQRQTETRFDDSPARRVRGNPSPQPPPRNGEGEKDIVATQLLHSGTMTPPLRFGEGAGGRGAAPTCPVADEPLRLP